MADNIGWIFLSKGQLHARINAGADRFNRIRDYGAQMAKKTKGVKTKGVKNQRGQVSTLNKNQWIDYGLASTERQL